MDMRHLTLVLLYFFNKFSLKNLGKRDRIKSAENLMIFYKIFITMEG